MSRLSLFIASFLILMVGGYAFFRFIDGAEDHNPFLKWVDSEAIWYAEIASDRGAYDRFFETSLLWKDLENTPMGQTIEAINSLWDSLNTPVGMAVYAMDAGQAQNYFIMLSDGSSQAYQQLISNQSLKGNSKQVQSITKIPGYFSVHVENITWLSPCESCLNALVNQKNTSSSLADQPDFMAVYQENSNGLYVNLKSGLSNPWKLPLHSKLENGVSGGWVSLDLKSKSNTISISGLIPLANDSIANLSLQEPQPIDFLGMLPVATTFFKAYSISNPDEYLKNIRENHSVSTNIDQLSNMRAWLGNNWIQGEFMSPDESLNTAFHLISIKDSSLCTNDLIDPSELASKSEKYGSILILELPNTRFESLGQKANQAATFAAIINNYLIITYEKAAIKQLIKAIQSGYTMQADAQFSSLHNDMLQTASYMYYLSPAVSGNKLREQLGQRFYQNWMPDTSVSNNIQAFIVQMVKHRNYRIYVHGSMRHQPIQLSFHPSALWELNLNAPVSTKPQLIKNHKTGMRDVLIQDDQHTLKLINSTGEVQWTYALQKPVLWPVEQVDGFKNGKLQILFNTSDSLYCLDRLGHKVEPFPIALERPTRWPLSLFDYDRNRAYRIFISDTIGDLTVYNVQGLKVKGWQYQNDRIPFSEPVRHFSIQGKDYIFVVKQNGGLELINRKGKTRFKAKNSATDKQGDSFLFLGRSIKNSGIFYIDTTGSVIKSMFDGSREVLPIKSEKGDNLEVKWSSSMNEYVFCVYNPRLIKGFASDGRQLFNEIAFENAGSKPYFYTLNDQLWVGYTNKANQMAYLVNFAGVSYSGFPIAGDTPFSIADINKDGVFEALIADRKNRIYCYALSP